MKDLEKEAIERMKQDHCMPRKDQYHKLKIELDSLKNNKPIP
jgi:hypothetical protein